MAKKVYPGAAFEPCDNEVLPFTFDLFAQISLLAPLPAKAKENLEKCPGAMRLRRFGPNDLMCRQGDEDCTAFYILKAEDVHTLRNYPDQRSRQISIESTAAQAKIVELQAAASKAQADARPKDLEKAQKQLKELEEKLDLWQRESAQLPELREKVNRLKFPQGQAGADLLAILKVGDQANAQLAQREQQAVASGDKQKAGAYRELRTADARRKRARADQLQAEDAELAGLLRASAQTAELRRAAVVYLGEAPASADVEAAGWFDRLKRMLTGVPTKGPDQAPVNLPFDGPTDVSTRTRQAYLFEGELFGEMACLNRAPRSASVVAERECYVLEMLSNILMEIDKDPGYQAERARVYEERALDLQLRALSIFVGLTDQEFARASLEVRGQLKLRSFKSGAIICDEHERSDCVYLVRGGLVQVKKNVTSLVSLADVTSWPEVLTALRGDGAAALRKRLLVEACNLLESAKADDQLSPEERAIIVHGLNEAIKDAQLPALPEFKDLVIRRSLHERVRSHASYQAPRQVDVKELDDVIKSASLREVKAPDPGKTEKWSDLDLRHLNRLLVEEIVPNGLRRLPRAAGPSATLTYLSRGEFIGEMGVCRGLPRSSTCIAFGQPRNFKDEDLGEVELVQIPGEVFLHLMELFPAIKACVDAEIARREKRDEQHARQHQAGATTTRTTKESDRLGLIQGQQLMLIDMERCTMCLECVKGCVDAHDDGRSRLFLVGNRYEKYLVPITCRACLDPVCMIGCPVRSIQRGDNHEMVIKDWCIGCRMCAKNCPYDAIKMHDLPAPVQDFGVERADAPATFRIREEIAVVCDLCSSLPDQTPRCVYACPHEAAQRVNGRQELPTL